jgi:HTH-type transcriptional regulator/antitoxin HigA
LPDSYFRLVKRFPLIRIRDDDHLDEASEVIDRLIEKELDEGAQAYLDVLTDLVEAYEDEHVSVSDANEADVLRELMRMNDLSQAELAKAVGIAQSTLSAVLSGTRKLTRQHVVKLATYFKVPGSVFLPAEVR